MTDAEHAAWLTSLVMQIGVNVVLPMLTLLVMVVSLWVLMVRANHQGVETSKIFLDDSGKVSMGQVLKASTWAFHTFMSIIALVVYPNTVEFVLVQYAGTWAPTALVFEYMKRKMPVQQVAQ